MKKVLLLFSLCASAGTLFGQREVRSITDSVFMIDEVSVVTNRSRVNLLGINAPLKDLPMTVTRISGEMLERKNILNLEDAVRFLPGVTVSDQLGAFQRYSVRGTSDAVITYDGFRDERTLQNTMPFDDLAGVESIEVIKGPSSILSGHSVMGGVINIVRKKASDQFSAYARLGYGSWNQKQSTMGFGGKIAGPVNYYANFHYVNGDGYRNVGADRISGRFSLGADVGRTGHLSANFNITDNKYRTEIGSAPLMPSSTDAGPVYLADGDKLYAEKGELNPMADYHTTYNDPQNHMRSRAWDANLQYSQKVTDWMELRNRFSYSFRNTDYAAIENLAYRTSTDPIYDWYYMKGKTKTYIELDSLRSGNPLVFNPESYSYNNKLELTGRLQTGSVTHRYTGGWDFMFYDFTQYNGYGSDDVWGPGKNQMVSVVDPHRVRDWWDYKVSAATIRRQTTNGIYLIDVIDISEKWKAMGGLRFDMYGYRNATATTTDGEQHYDNENRSDWTKVKTSALTYRAGVVYNPLKALTIYASASNYFKPDNKVYTPSNIYINMDGNKFNPDQDGGEIFKPERGDQAELGVRVNLSRIFEFNASVFYINKYDVVKDFGNINVEEEGATVRKRVYAQIGKAGSKGFDMDFTVRPVSTLQIVGGWGWTDYRNFKIKNSGAIKELFPNFSEETNVRATNVPRTTFFAYADYTIPRGPLKDLSFHLSGTYQDRIYRNIADNLYYPSLFLVDVGVYYTIKNNILVSLNINNVFDKEYFVKTTTLGKPINYMLGLTYKFR